MNAGAIYFSSLSLMTCLLILSPSNNLIQSVKSPRGNKQNIGGVDGDGLSLWLACRALLWYVNGCSLEHFEQSLLYPLSPYVPQVMEPSHTADLVNLIKKDDT